MSTHASSHARHSNSSDLITEAEAILEKLSDSDAANGKAMAAKVREAIESLKDKAVSAKEQIRERLDQTETTIKHHPWASVSVAASVGVGVGLLIGYLAARRND